MGELREADNRRRHDSLLTLGRFVWQASSGRRKRTQALSNAHLGIKGSTDELNAPNSNTDAHFQPFPSQTADE